MFDASRKIIHVDMDAFFASVEQRDNPELRGLPVAVGHAEERGVVAAASYEARKFGVHSAMSSAMAKRLCPHIVFVHGRMDRYKEVSAQVHDIFHRYTEVIEPLSLDEAFLDVTVNKPGMEMAVDIAKRIKAEIRSELNLVASAGVSYNKFLAKVASDWRKPDGLCTIHPSQALDFIADLKIERFWGVGPVTAKKMHSLGIHTGADLRSWPLEMLVKVFGKQGALYHDFANGIDLRPVEVYRERKSVGCERTLDHDISSIQDIEAVITDLADELMARLSRKDFRGTTLTLKVKFNDFTQITRSLSGQVAYTEGQMIISTALKLTEAIFEIDKPVRLIGLSVSNKVQTYEEVWQQLYFEFGQ